MPATGSVYTQNTSFGVSNGPTYSGQIVVPAIASGTETYRNYSAQVLNTAALQVVDALGFVFANWLAMGFMMVLDSVQTHVGGPTPAELLAATVTIRLTDAGTAAADFDIVLGVGQSMSWVVAPVGLNSDCASITIDGDTVCDCNVYGLLLLSA